MLELCSLKTVNRVISMKIKTGLIIRIALYLAFIFLFPKIATVLIVCGLIDCLRNRPINSWLFYKYFFGKGALTWLLSPFNLLADLLTLSWGCQINKDSLPDNVQQEIDHMLNNIPSEAIITALQDKMGDNQRGMIFFKWYGTNKSTDIDAPAFNHQYRYIQTIGVSAFNKHSSTSRHFGPLRFTYRLLYNLRPKKDNGVYIEANNKHHFWYQNPLFIFDDTYVHQSFNESDDIRYCLFVDFIRPSPLPGAYWLLHQLTRGVHYLMKSKSFIFYKNWKNLDTKPKQQDTKE